MTKAENIRNQCMKILDKYDADYRGVTVDRIDGTTYVIFKYYGGTNDTVDRNDDSWDEIFELDGVVDIGYGEGYGIEGKYEDSLLIELDEDIIESKKSARKSIKEEYDPTDDIVNKGNSVSMDYETFIKFTDGLGIRFNTKDAKIVYLSNDIKMEFGDSVLVIPKDDILDIVVNAHSSMEIKSKFIEQVASVSLDKNDILRADFFTKEGNVLTVWWEV